MKTMMTAVRIARPGQIEASRVEIPDVSRGKVRLRVEGCGVCASNLGPWKGLPWQSYPMEWGGGGHEAWGVVDAVAEDVDVQVGTRVAALSFNAYAEYDIAQATHLVPLPPAMDGKPFPGEPVGCALNIFRRSRVSTGDTVGIVGIGFLGGLLAQLCKAAGARVLAISRRRAALRIAEEVGADEMIPMDDHRRIIGKVEELTGGQLCDRVIEAVGLQWPLDLSAELTRERGTLVIAGYHQDGPRQVNMQQWNWRGIDVINAHERDPMLYIRGMRAGLDAIVSKKITIEPLLRHSFPLARLDEALDSTLERPDNFVKAWVHT